MDGGRLKIAGANFDRSFYLGRTNTYIIHTTAMDGGRLKITRANFDP